MTKQRMQVGLSLGSSFAELCAIDSTGKTIFQARSYLPKEPLKDLIRKMATELEAFETDRVHVCLRALEKIFPTRLGGSVAQIVTMGFETWPWLRQPMTGQHFSMMASRSEPLASQELIFGISERVTATGQITKSVSLAELQSLATRLKAKDIKKVCVNLLFSQKNPQNEIQTKKFFHEAGFEVFCLPRTEQSTDEVTAWRTNILNACLSGTYLELDREIQEAFKLAYPQQDPQHEIQYINSLGQLESKPLQNVSTVLFGWSGLLNKHKYVLYLGIEKWAWVKPEVCERWQSPWGSIEIPHRSFLPLAVQSTCLLEKDFFDHITWGPEQGYEPGPMTFGRAQKPLIADVLMDSWPKAKKQFESVVSTQGENRFKEAISILQKTSAADTILADLFERVLHSMLITCIDIKADEKIELCGFWGEFAIKSLQKSFPHLKFHLIEANSEANYAAKLT